MNYNFYLSALTQFTHPVLGPNCWRPAVLAYLDTNIDEWALVENPMRNNCLTVVGTTEDKHVILQDIVGITRILPIISAIPSQIKANLDTSLSSLFPGVALMTMRNILEVAGFNMAWATGVTTMRDVWTYLIHYNEMSQWCNRDNRAYLQSVFTAGLDTTVSTLSAAVRTAVANWMTAHGMNTTWIIGTTKIRDVLHYIVLHLPPTTLDPLGMRAA